MSGPDLSASPRLPRDPDGPVFEEPWQAQAFALAVRLHEQGVFSWAEWAQALSARLAAAGEADDGSRYYEHWLAALEDLATVKRLTHAAELSQRKHAWAAAFARTPHGKPVEL